MPRFDGTGPLGQGMFTGRGEGYCMLRLPEPGSGEPAAGYAGMQGRPVRVAQGLQQPLATPDADAPAAPPGAPLWAGCRRRAGRRGRTSLRSPTR